jgi:hypothetical protein
MKSGLLCCQFSTEDGLGSGLIRYLSDSDFSHVDLMIPQGIALQHGRPIPTRYGLLGARFNGGVQLRAPNYATFTRIALKGCIVPDIHAAYSFAFAQLGKPYDKGAILDFFLHRTRQFTPDEPSWFCDELAYTAYAQGGKLLLSTNNPLDLTPQEMYLSDDLLTQQGA